MELEKFIEYIIEARRRGFKDEVIKQSLLDKRWPEKEIDKAFKAANKKSVNKKTTDKKPVKKESKSKQELRKVREKTPEEESAIRRDEELNQGLINIRRTIEDKPIYGYTPSSEPYTEKFTKEVGGRHITLFLDDELFEALRKRAKKNMFKVTEQIEDILRRSVLSQRLKRKVPDDKLDDRLVGIFSRKVRKTKSTAKKTTPKKTAKKPVKSTKKTAKKAPAKKTTPKKKSIKKKK